MLPYPNSALESIASESTGPRPRELKTRNNTPARPYRDARSSVRSQRWALLRRRWSPASLHLNRKPPQACLESQTCQMQFLARRFDGRAYRVRHR